jgi:ferredoxin
MDDTDGKSNLRDGREKKGIYTATAGDDEYDQNREAAEICPVNIIRVEKF